jgi:hypothetical protein
MAEQARATADEVVMETNDMDSDDGDDGDDGEEDEDEDEEEEGDPQAAGRALVLAEGLVARHDWLRAVAAYCAAVQAYPHCAAEIAGDVAVAVTEAAAALTRSGAPPHVVVQQGVYIHEQVLRVDPGNARVWNALGTWFHRSQRYVEALRCFEKVCAAGASLVPTGSHRVHCCGHRQWRSTHTSRWR